MDEQLVTAAETTEVVAVEEKMGAPKKFKKTSRKKVCKFCPFVSHFIIHTL